MAGSLLVFLQHGQRHSALSILKQVEMPGYCTNAIVGGLLACLPFSMNRVMLSLISRLIVRLGVERRTVIAAE